MKWNMKAMLLAFALLKGGIRSVRHKEKFVSSIARKFHRKTALYHTRSSLEKTKIRPLY